MLSSKQLLGLLSVFWGFLRGGFPVSVFSPDCVALSLFIVLDWISKYDLVCLYGFLSFSLFFLQNKPLCSPDCPETYSVNRLASTADISLPPEFKML